MTTTMPFTQNALGKITTVGAELVYIDAETKITWTSTDAKTWTSHVWTGTIYPVVSWNIVFFNGYFWFWVVDADLERLYTLKSANGFAWTSLGYQAYSTPYDFEFDKSVVHGGSIIDIGGNRTLLRTTSNGLDWSEQSISFPPGIVKIVSYGSSIYAIPSGGAFVKTVYRSDNNGLTWPVITTDWGLDASLTVDCVVTTDGLLVVQENNQTWTSLNGVLWTRSNYTPPVNTMANGKICALGMDLFIAGCGASRNTVFKLIASSAPVAIPL